MDRDAVARGIRDEYNNLAQRAQVEGVSVYLKRRPARERVNQIFLLNTIRAVHQGNKHAQLREMWGDRDERSRRSDGGDAAHQGLDERAAASPAAAASSGHEHRDQGGSPSSRDGSASPRRDAHRKRRREQCVGHAHVGGELSDRETPPRSLEGGQYARRDVQPPPESRGAAKRAEGPSSGVHCSDRSDEAPHRPARGDGKRDGAARSARAQGGENAPTPESCSGASDWSDEGVRQSADGAGDCASGGIRDGGCDMGSGEFAELLKRNPKRGRGGRGPRINDTGPYPDSDEELSPHPFLAPAEAQAPKRLEARSRAACDASLAVGARPASRAAVDPEALQKLVQQTGLPREILEAQQALAATLKRKHKKSQGKTSGKKSKRK